MNNSHKKIDSQFIVRVLRDEVSLEEREYFSQWLNESEEHKSEFAAVSLLWDSMNQSRTPEAPNIEDQWNKVMGKISSTTPESISEKKLTSRWKKERLSDRGKKIRTQWKRRSLGIGITLLLMALTISIVVKSRLDSKASVLLPELAEVVTGNGEKVVITLTDGTIVYLNSGSRLTYPKIFTDSVRLVSIEGEGYFSVAKNPLKPFRIITGTSLTQVTGTEFNIRFRRDSLVVAVTEGSVMVAQRTLQDQVHLHRGDAAICASNILSSQSHVDLEKYVAWRKNKLAFTRAPLRDVMDEVERCFNVSVVFTKDAVQRKTLTGIFSTESLDGILGNISLAMNIHIQRNGKTVVVQ